MFNVCNARRVSNFRTMQAMTGFIESNMSTAVITQVSAYDGVDPPSQQGLDSIIEQFRVYTSKALTIPLNMRLRRVVKFLTARSAGMPAIGRQYFKSQLRTFATLGKGKFQHDDVNIEIPKSRKFLGHLSLMAEIIRPAS